jgi:hypothetical protein
MGQRKSVISYIWLILVFSIWSVVSPPSSLKVDHMFNNHNNFFLLIIIIYVMALTHQFCFDHVMSSSSFSLSSLATSFPRCITSYTDLVILHYCFFVAVIMVILCFKCNNPTKVCHFIVAILFFSQNAFGQPTPFQIVSHYFVLNQTCLTLNSFTENTSVTTTVNWFR